MDQNIIDRLQKKGKLDARAVQAVLDLMHAGKNVEQALVGGTYVSDLDFAMAKSEALGLPFLDLTTLVIPKETLELIPADIMESYKSVPTAFDGHVLSVAMMHPEKAQEVQALEFFASEHGWGLSIQVSPTSQIKSLIKKVKGLGAEVATALAQAKGKFGEKAGKQMETAKLEDVIKGAPVSRMVSVIMRHAVEGGASDIHIEPMGSESRVRYRIDGVLRTSLVLPIYVHPALISRIKVLSNLKIDETRIPQDGRITQDINGKKIDFRISTMPVLDNEKIVMRVLDTTTSAPTLENLGFRKEHIDLIKQQIRRPHGLFLVTGPTGSGKSTTLFAVLNLLNAEGININTLEDPIEYYIPGVNQSQIRPEIDYTFAAGLRALLRQDPNVIMVGEIRDRETTELSIHASLTGHLMFSTLHTNDVYGIVPRLIDMGAEPFLLGATLNLGIAQRLARKICSFCKEEQVVDPAIRQSVQKELVNLPKKYLDGLPNPSKPPVFFHGKGCSRCGDSGYQGRVSIAELFEYTVHARKLIEEGFPLDGFRKELARQESLTLRQDALLKAVEGVTTLEEVFRISQDVQEDV